jgi:hypothetical protein
MEVSTTVFIIEARPPTDVAATTCWGERERLRQAPFFLHLNHGRPESPERRKKVFEPQEPKEARESLPPRVSLFSVSSVVKKEKVAVSNKANFAHGQEWARAGKVAPAGAAGSERAKQSQFRKEWQV